MYTTLNFLKSNEACKPGYAEMISFFGTSKKMMDVKIPLAVCALVLSKDNFNWLVTNAIIIDREQFKLFRSRWIVALHDSSVWGFSLNTKRASAEQIKLLRMARTEASIDAVIDDLRHQRVYGFTHAHDARWTSPAFFLESVLDHWMDKVEYREKEALKKEGLHTHPAMVNVGNHWFDLPERHVAFLFSDTPYADVVQFMIQHPEMARKGMDTKLDTSGETPKITMTMTDERTIFDAYRFMSASADLQERLANRTTVQRNNMAENSEDEEEDAEEEA